MRRYWSLASAAAVWTPLILGSLGCRDDSERESLRGLLVNMAEALKEDYQEEMKGHPRDEWAVRRGALMARRDLKVLDDFVAKSPALSERGKGAVESVREVDKKRIDLFEGVIKSGRFKLTEAEKAEMNRLMNERNQRLQTIGRIVDGAE